MARQGKIARLPHALRDQVNRRLLNGETAKEILGWLNEEPGAIETWDSHFEGAPANPQNLSEWRLGGFKDFIKKRDKVEHLKSLSSFCLDAAKAGKNISDGAAAIAAGKLLSALEGATVGGDADEGIDLSELIKGIKVLRDGDHASERIDLDKLKHQTKTEQVAMDREKFEKQTAEQFFKWAKTKEAQAILDSGKPRGIQMAEMRQLMFGDRKRRKQ